MIVSVASGKGGTGKTTVATNLALSMGPQVQFLDCDVEEPNAHLFLQPEIKRSETVFMPVPQVDADKCTLCGKCEEICQFKAIVVIKDLSVMTFPELCHSCGGCTAVCPEGAISETRRELGLIQTGRCRGITFSHGKLRIGEAMAPPMIRRVREETDPQRLVIIDAPPGTSCPVIAAAKDTDFVLLVTEPTPFGLHDLRLAVEAVRTLGIPSGLVINRADAGNDDVRTYAGQQNLPILMEIPFDRGIAEAYARGRMIVDVRTEYRDKFKQLGESIYKRVESYQ
jgi:MinD superfamily P-loop ATPase